MHVTFMYVHVYNIITLCYGYCQSVLNALMISYKGIPCSIVHLAHFYNVHVGIYLCMPKKMTKIMLWPIPMHDFIHMYTCTSITL